MSWRSATGREHYRTGISSSIAANARLRRAACLAQSQSGIMRFAGIEEGIEKGIEKGGTRHVGGQEYQKTGCLRIADGFD